MENKDSFSVTPPPRRRASVASHQPQVPADDSSFQIRFVAPTLGGAATSSSREHADEARGEDSSNIMDTLRDTVCASDEEIEAAEEVLQQNEAMMSLLQEQEESFLNLPRVQQMTSFLEGRGLGKDDPMYLLIDVFDLADGRMRGLYHEQRVALARMAQYNLSVFHAMQILTTQSVTAGEHVTAAMQRLERMEAALERIEGLGKSLGQNGESMVNSMIECQKANFAAIKEVDEYSIKATVIRYALVVVAILAGMAIHALMF